MTIRDNPLPFLLLVPAAALLAQEPPAEPPPAIVVEDEADDPDSEYYVAPEPAAKPARRSELADPKRVRETATLVCGLLGEAHVLRKPFDERMSPAAWTNCAARETGSGTCTPVCSSMSAAQIRPRAALR